MKNQKLKIVITILVPSSIVYSGKTGGLVRLTEILKRIAIFNETKIIVISSDKNYAEYFKENNVSVDFRFIRSNLQFKSLLGFGLKSLFIIVKTFFVLKWDFLKSETEKIIIYASSDLFWEVIPAFIFKIRNKGFEWVQVIHHIYPDWKKRPGNKIIGFLGYYLQKFSLWLIRKKADKIILMNNLVKNDLLLRNFDEEKMYVSANGINFDYFNSLEKAGLSYAGVFLGRLDASKGVSDFIPIWKKVCEKIPEAKLAIIGGGEENFKRKLSRKIKESGMEKNIEMLGFLENDKVFPILKSSKIFLFPSYEEGWGIAIAEAMACGLPVVSWNLPVYKEIFEKHTIQVEENDLDVFSEEIIKLLEREDLRKKIADEGKEFIQKHSWDNVAKKEYEIIIKC